MALEIGHVECCERAGEAAPERFNVPDGIRIGPEAANPHRAVVLVADGDGLRGTPFLVELLALGEVVDVGFEGGLEGLVPVHEVSQNRQGLGGQGVQPGLEGVGEAAFVDEHRELRFAYGELGAGLDFPVLHGEAVHQQRRVGLDPVDDIDELLTNEIAQTHSRPPCLEVYRRYYRNQGGPVPRL